MPAGLMAKLHSFFASNSAACLSFMIERASIEVCCGVAANIAGVCLGASQSAGRALVGYLTPADRHAEFFGLWGLAVKLASILGPLSYGAVTWLTDNDHRVAMLITGTFFVLGLAVLASVDPERGRRAVVASAG
jgi:UMF1 family MFS transporter